MAHNCSNVQVTRLMLKSFKQLHVNTTLHLKSKVHHFGIYRSIDSGVEAGVTIK